MAQQPRPVKAGETKIERYWRLKAQYEATKAVADQLFKVHSQARFRKETASHMLEAARLELKVRNYDDYRRDVIVISVALIATAVSAFVCPPLTAVIVRKMGYNVAGRMGAKVTLRVAICAFAVSSGSQYTASYLATGRGSAMLGVAYETLFKKSLEQLLTQLPESVTLLSCLKPNDMYNTLISLSQRADAEAGKITKSPEERRVLARTILLKFWENIYSDCTLFAMRFLPQYGALEAEVLALERELQQRGPIPPPSVSRQ